MNLSIQSQMVLYYSFLQKTKMRNIHSGHLWVKQQAISNIVIFRTFIINKKELRAIVIFNKKTMYNKNV